MEDQRKHVRTMLEMLLKTGIYLKLHRCKFIAKKTNLWILS